MAVTRNVYDPNLIINPPFIRIEKSAGTAEFIIIQDEVVELTGPQMRMEIRKPMAWFRVEPDLLLTPFNKTPQNLSPVPPNYPKWDLIRLILKENELFVIEYSGTPMDENHRNAVTGYQMSAPTDRIFVQIDQTTNVINLFVETRETTQMPDDLKT